MMPKPKREVLSAMSIELHGAADMINHAKNSDHLLEPAKVISRMAWQIMQLRTEWRAMRTRDRA